MGKKPDVYLNGMVKWMQVNKPDPWDNWKVSIYPDQPSRDKINELKDKGLKNEWKKDEDGEFMVFRRPKQKTMRGQVVVFGEPAVFDQDGKPWNRDLIVGNGSTGTVKLETYTYKTPAGKEGLAARFGAFKVKDYVAFDKAKDFDNNTLKQAGKIDEVDQTMNF